MSGAVLAACLAALAVGAASKTAEPVTCGSTIKLQHVQTKARLHSHEVMYSSGSGQQSVTGYPDGVDSNSYWEVAPALVNTPGNTHELVACPQGLQVADGATIRLRHGATHRWLHSHKFPAPMSQNQEVSAFGGEDETNTGDNWKVEVDGGGPWTTASRVRLLHVDTNVYLATHDKRFGRPIAGQTEVFGARQKSAGALWSTAEGVYFPTRDDL